MKREKDDLAIGVDLGATKIASALVTAQGEIVASRQTLTEASEGPEAVLKRIAAEVNALAADAPSRVLGVGIGSPGQVDPRAGVVRNAVNLGWEIAPLAAGVRSQLTADAPVWIEKDANASAVGEYFFGAARGCDDFVYLAVGSGLGGGVFANGALVSGADHNASELGHLSLDPNGRLCSCGLRGCAETVISGKGLLALTREKLAGQTLPTHLTTSSDLTTAAVIAAAEVGDALALAALAEVARWLGLVMAVCVAVLNPARIVVGGGLGLAASDFLLTGAQSELRRRVLASSYQHLEIRRSQLTSSAVGAACLVWNAGQCRLSSKGGDRLDGSL